MQLRARWVMNAATIFFGTVSLAGAAAYVLSRWKDKHSAACAAKAVASTSFVALAFANGALETSYGQAILAALLLSWLGDMLLLSPKHSFLLAGMAAFFAAHIAFMAAFGQKEIDLTWLGGALAATGVLSVLVIVWLWKYLGGVYKVAVPLYLAAIMVMTSLAVAASSVSLPQTVALAAIAFAVSDISVARDRFIDNSIANKAWGLPLYYLAQVLLAASVNAG
ncbi:MAG: lysoplasmalogenase family protein [Pyrinomonadaceae bacterium]